MDQYLQRPSLEAPRCRPGTATAWAGPESAAAAAAVASIGDCFPQQRRPWRPFPSFFWSASDSPGVLARSLREKEKGREGEASTVERRAGLSFQCYLGAGKREKSKKRVDDGNEKKQKTPITQASLSLLLHSSSAFFTHAYILTPNSPLGRSLCLACLDTLTPALSNNPSM